MNRKIVYLINPISGTGNKKLLIRKIEEKTRGQNIPFEILPTDPNGNYLHLKEKISREQVTDVVVCGGDGTVNQVARSLLNEDIRIGIIPMGSGNGLALTAKIPRQPDRALSVVLNGKAAYIDSFFINDHFSCMLCGLGFDAQVAHDFARQAKRGLYTYMVQTVSNFMRMRAWSFELVAKGHSFAVPGYFISIANSNQFGNQFTIAPRAKLNDGLLDIVVVKKMSKWRFIGAVLRQLLVGKPFQPGQQGIEKRKVLYFQTDELIIHNNDNAPLHIDGDPSVSSKLFKIKIIRDAFKLIQPQ